MIAQRVTPWLAMLLVWSPPATAATSPQTTGSGRTLEMSIHAFTKTWLLHGEVGKAAGFLSLQAADSPCIAEQLRERKQRVTQQNARSLLVDYLARVREQIAARGLLRSAQSLSDVIEPLPIEDTGEGGTTGTSASESTIVRLGAETIREVACDEREADWLVRVSMRNPLVAQAFKVKGVARGEIAPVILIWKKEKTSWKVLAVGAPAP